jgi:hypothetical protein
LLCLGWKNWKPCLSWSKNLEYAYVSPENFFLTMLMLVRKIFWSPPVDNISGKICTTWKISQEMLVKTWRHPPPPNVDGFATSLEICQLKKIACDLLWGQGVGHVYQFYHDVNSIFLFNILWVVSFL